MVFSGEGFDPCHYDSGTVSQTFAVTCCATLSFCYAFESAQTNAMTSFPDDAHGDFRVLVAGGPCGAITTAWRELVQPVLHPGVVAAGNGHWMLPWRSVSLSICGYQGCQVTVEAKAVSRGPIPCWARLDHVVASAAGCL